MQSDAPGPPVASTPLAYATATRPGRTGADIGDLLPFNFKNKPEPTPSFRAMLPCAIYDRRPVNVIRVL
jgi:hypothetical protein